MRAPEDSVQSLPPDTNVRNKTENDANLELLTTRERLTKVMTRHAGECSLKFQNIRMQVAVPWWMPEFATPGVPGETKQILRGVSAHASSGQVLAIIGASGSGKTTLLDRLANVDMIPGGEWSGKITVNSADLTNEVFRRNCAYIHQDDRLWGALTVYENLQIASQLYNANCSPEQREGRIEEVLEATGLTSCKHNKVGNVLIKGISGGQRRRVSIAVELMGSAQLMFLDEPTSGLDSKSAAEVMQLLTSLAKSLNIVIVCSIHQPSTRTFLAFDLTLLLSQGKVAYFGPAKDALSYFESQGFKSPPNMNPADYLIEISNPDFTTSQQVDKIIDVWEKEWKKRGQASAVLNGKKGGSSSLSERNGDLKMSRVGNRRDTEPGELKERNRKIPLSTTSLSSPTHAASCIWQVLILCRRMTMSYMRDPGAYLGRAVLYTAMSTIFGIIYVGSRSKTQEHVLDILFTIAWGMATPSYMASMILPVFTFERAIFGKEVKNGMYSPISYVIATSCVQVIFVFMTSTLSVIPYYWIDNINPDPSVFLAFWLLQFSFLFTIESLCVIFSALIPNFIIALGVTVSTLSNFFVFNGLFVTPSSIPWVFRWIEYISPHAYATRGLSKLAFSGQAFSGFDDCIASCFGRDGDEVLDNVQGLSSNVNVGAMFGVLWAMAIGLRIGHWLILREKS